MTGVEPPPPIEELERDPPAVANLLLHGGTPNGDALAATVLDLAARHVVEIEEISPTEHLCHVPRHTNSPGLQPFEMRVLELLRDRAVDGTVPASALTVGIRDETDNWWRGFVAEVNDAAKRSGYLSGWLRAVAVILAGLFVVATWILLVASSQHHGSTVLRAAAVLSFVACVVGGSFLLEDLPVVPFGASYRLRRSGLGFDLSARLQRLSRRGHREAHWWQHARHLLGADHAFLDERAAGVTIWSRYVPYAVALGLAPTAAHDVPIGPDGAGSTWVRRGDTWRRVNVRYPKRVPPGWGYSPLRAGLTSTALVAGYGTLIVLALRSGVWYPHPPFAAGVARAIGDMEPVIAGIALVGFGIGIWELALALRDVATGPVLLAGVVVARRLRSARRWNPWADLFPEHWYVAVDDGTSARLRGLRIPHGLFQELDRGDTVEVTVSPYLHHVQHVTVVRRRKGRRPV